MRTGVLLIDDVVIIHHEPRPDGSRQMPEVGIVIPAHASALGKAMLAFLPEDEKRVLAAGDLRSMTGETITSPDDAARRSSTQVRSSGIAAEQDEAVHRRERRWPARSSTRTARPSAPSASWSRPAATSTHDARDLVRETARAALPRARRLVVASPDLTRMTRRPAGT